MHLDLKEIDRLPTGSQAGGNDVTGNLSNLRINVTVDNKISMCSE